MPEEEVVSIGADVDVRALMEEIREEVERKREQGVYPPDVLAELDALRAPDTSFGDDALDRTIVDLHRTSGFSPEVTTASEKPVVAPAVSAAKRGILALMRWYLSGVLHQISTFAGNVVRAVRLLRDRTAALAERLDELESAAGREQEDGGQPGDVDDLREVVDELRRRLAALEEERVDDRLRELDRAVRDLDARLGSEEES